MTLFDIFGWLGSILFALCALPQAIQCAKTRTAQGIDKLFLGMWLSGEILTTIYVWPKQDWPLLFNYFLNLTFLAVIIYWKINDFRRKI